MSNVGFIGLGIMGAPMAEHILDGGYQLYGHTRSGVPQRLIDKGAVVCAHPQEVAERSDVIICMLPDTPTLKRFYSEKMALRRGWLKVKLLST